jgi:hypothetical protein
MTVYAALASFSAGISPFYIFPSTIQGTVPVFLNISSSEKTAFIFAVRLLDDGLILFAFDMFSGRWNGSVSLADPSGQIYLNWNTSVYRRGHINSAWINAVCYSLRLNNARAGCQAPFPRGSGLHPAAGSTRCFGLDAGDACWDNIDGRRASSTHSGL